ncbi:MAG: hypothetical protein JNM69_24905 [Archangium sp.]|nr:hypothetical protein [Archangium sp.]
MVLLQKDGATSGHQAEPFILEDLEETTTVDQFDALAASFAHFTNSVVLVST